MQSAESFPYSFVDEAVVFPGGFPAHAAEEADSLHGDDDNMDYLCPRLSCFHYHYFIRLGVEQVPHSSFSPAPVVARVILS
jgi:hypothetical protein